MSSVQAGPPIVDSGQGPIRPQRTGWSPSSIVITIVFVVVLAIVVAGVLIYWSVMNSFNRPPAAYPAPISLRTERVVLSVDQPIVEGRFNLIEGAASAQDTLVGLNVGVPLGEPSGSFVPSVTSPARTLDPAALLTTPTVRLTTSPAFAAQSCLAPCELIVRSGFNCVTGTCRLDIEFTLELVGESVPRSSRVAVDVSGAVTTNDRAPLPAGLQIHFAVGQEATDGN